MFLILIHGRIVRQQRDDYLLIVSRWSRLLSTSVPTVTQLQHGARTTAAQDRGTQRWMLPTALDFHHNLILNILYNKSRMAKIFCSPGLAPDTIFLSAVLFTLRFLTNSL